MSLSICRRLLKPAAAALRRYYSPMSDSPLNKVAILGACGGLGQPLALMLKRSEYVAELALYDKIDTAGLCADLSHISTKAAVSGYQGNDQLADCLTGEAVRGAADAIVAVKAGGGSATLSVAAAAHRFVNSVLLALDGRQNIVESAFVESSATPEVPFFSSPLLFGQDGVERNMGIGKLSDYEAELLKAAVAELRGQIEKGQEFGRAWTKR